MTRNPAFETRGQAVISYDIACDCRGCWVASIVRIAFWETRTFPVTVTSDMMHDASCGTMTLPLMTPLNAFTQLASPARADETVGYSYH